jgi:predicted nucleic acid-binding protein
LAVTLDSSIILAALRNQEEKHEQCRWLLEAVEEAQIIAIQPYSVLSEVTNAIKRRTSSQRLAERIKQVLQSINTMNFVEPEARRTEMVSDIAMRTDMGIMDAVVVQIAFEFGTTLISLDEEMMKKAKSIVKTKTVDEFLAAQQ